MNKVVKQLWIDALLSKEYKQGAGCLQSMNGSFCCLGVLSDLYIKEFPGQARWMKHGNDRIAFYGDGALSTALLPDEVREWAGLDSHSPMIDNQALTGLNDQGTPFYEISDLIKYNL